MKTLHFYNRIHYAWEKTPVPPNCVIQSFVEVLNFHQFGSKFIKKSNKNQRIFMI